jgi:hypothetical protein
MLLVAPVREAHRLATTESTAEGLQRVHDVRSTLPAITHVDYSARIQTVDTLRNPPLRQLLERFHSRTGCPVLVNTSFNVRDEPIVCSWLDALACFMRTNLDVLVLDNLILRKSDQGGLDLERLEERRRRVEDEQRRVREATWFVVSLVAALCLLAYLVSLRMTSPWLALTLLAVAGVTVVVAFAAPSARPRIEQLFQKITLPIRAIVTVLLLGLVYYAMVTPIGLFLRWRGHSIRVWPADEKSAWMPAEQRDLESYFRTY